MKVTNAIIGLIGFALILLTAGCTTTRELNIKKLEDNNFHLSKITFMIRQDTDKGNKGKIFIAQQFPGLLKIVKSDLRDDHSLVFDYADFISANNNGKTKIKREVIDLGGKTKINKYTWENQSKYDQRATVLLPFAVRDDGTLKATVILEKDNPKDISQPFETSLDVIIKYKKVK